MSYNRKRRQRSDDLRGTWECSACTFQNTPESYKCSMCQTRKGTSTRYLYHKSKLFLRKPRPNSEILEQQQFIAKTVLKVKEDNKDRKIDKGSSNFLSPQIKNIDRSHPLTFKIFANGFDVVITEYKPKFCNSITSSMPNSPAISNCSSSIPGNNVYDFNHPSPSSSEAASFIQQNSTYITNGHSNNSCAKSDSREHSPTRSRKSSNKEIPKDTAIPTIQSLNGNKNKRNSVKVVDPSAKNGSKSSEDDVVSDSSGSFGSQRLMHSDLSDSSMRDEPILNKKQQKVRSSIRFRNRKNFAIPVSCPESVQASDFVPVNITRKRSRCNSSGSTKDEFLTPSSASSPHDITEPSKKACNRNSLEIVPDASPAVTDNNDPVKQTMYIPNGYINNLSDVQPITLKNNFVDNKNGPLISAQLPIIELSPNSVNNSHIPPLNNALKLNNGLINSCHFSSDTSKNTTAMTDSIGASSLEIHNN